MFSTRSLIVGLISDQPCSKCSIAMCGQRLVCQRTSRNSRILAIGGVQGKRSQELSNKKKGGESKRDLPGIQGLGHSQELYGEEVPWGGSGRPGERVGRRQRCRSQGCCSGGQEPGGGRKELL